MMIGTIMGEISRLMIRVRNGITDRLRPSAAAVPSTVATRVEQMPMMKLLPTAMFHSLLEKKSAYQRSEKPAGSRLSILGVKMKYGSALKESGTTTIIGATRNAKISTQMARNV